MSRRNVEQPEPVRSSCVSSPHQSSWKLQRAPCTRLLFTTVTHTYCSPDLWLQPKITWRRNAPLGTDTGSGSCSALAILVFKAGLTGTESDSTQLPKSRPLHRRKVERSVKNLRLNLSSCWGGKAKIFGKAL